MFHVFKEASSLAMALAKRRRADRWLRWFRTCPACAAVAPPIDLLCEACHHDVAAMMHEGPKLKTRESPFRTYSLLSWNNSNDQLVGALAHGLKGGRHVRILEDWVVRFLYERQCLGALGYLGWAYPRSRRGDRDHAWLLAHLFREAYGSGRVVPLSYPPGPLTIGRQKHRGLRGRSEIEFAEVLEDISSIDRWIFIDDVITSGATARAAFHALKKPQRYEVWTLVDRAKLATRKGFW
jgi:hypothetical protein